MIDQLAKQLFNDIREGLGHNADSMSSSRLKSLLEAQLRKLNLVTREEFDAQSAVLARTREKLEAVETKLAEMEAAQQDATH